MDNFRDKNIYILPILMIIFIELLRTAWICDDSAITIRSVLNFTHGFGPTFNLSERVQAFTHPLWFLLLSLMVMISKNIFFSIFFISILCSLATAWILITRLSLGFWNALLVSSGLILSKAYLDFSTSGLENALSHLLIVSCIGMSYCTYEKHFIVKYTFL